MKTKTIDKLLEIITGKNTPLLLSERMNIIHAALEKEKQRKEQKKVGFKLYRHKGVMEMHLPANSIVEDKGDGIFEITINHKDIQPYSITSTGKVIINDVEKFDELFGRLAEAYLKNKEQDCITIVRAKCK